jgi:hypothetical protein
LRRRRSLWQTGREARDGTLRRNGWPGARRRWAAGSRIGSCTRLGRLAILSRHSRRRRRLLWHAGLLTTKRLIARLLRSKPALPRDRRSTVLRRSDRATRHRATRRPNGPWRSRGLLPRRSGLARCGQRAPRHRALLLPGSRRIPVSGHGWRALPRCPIASATRHLAALHRAALHRAALHRAKRWRIAARRLRRSAGSLWVSRLLRISLLARLLWIPLLSRRLRIPLLPRLLWISLLPRRLRISRLPRPLWIPLLSLRRRIPLLS